MVSGASPGGTGAYGEAGVSSEPRPKYPVIFLIFFEIYLLIQTLGRSNNQNLRSLLQKQKEYSNSAHIHNALVQ